MVRTMVILSGNDLKKKHLGVKLLCVPPEINKKMTY